MLDTNVLVSALGWEGSERQVYRYCRGGHLRMATSSALLGELERVLECALAADARWIVSGDPHLLKLGEFQSKQILTAPAALSRLG